MPVLCFFCEGLGYRFHVVCRRGELTSRRLPCAECWGTGEAHCPRHLRSKGVRATIFLRGRHYCAACAAEVMPDRRSA